MRPAALQNLMIASGALALILATPAAQADVAQGRAIALAPGKGNCQSCHQFPADARVNSRATVGPALTGIKSRFPDRAALTALIADARVRNPNTVMPPYGPHRLLTQDEISLVVDYLHTQ